MALKTFKNCPKCQSYIEKILDCDHITWKRCQHQFCCECFADYQKIQSRMSKHIYIISETGNDFNCK